MTDVSGSFFEPSSCVRENASQQIIVGAKAILHEGMSQIYGSCLTSILWTYYILFFTAINVYNERFLYTLYPQKYREWTHLQVRRL